MAIFEIIDNSQTGNTPYESFVKDAANWAIVETQLSGALVSATYTSLQQHFTANETLIAAKAAASHTHGAGGTVASIVANAAALGTGVTDGEIKLCADDGNSYTWEETGAKWRVRDGNKYTTAGLPAASTYNIATGTRVFDTTLNVWKEWNGTAWWTPIPLASAAQVGLPLVAQSAGNDIILDVLSPTAINTAIGLGNPSTAQVLHGDGWRNPTITLLGQGAITPSAASLTITLQSGYEYQEVRLDSAFGTAKANVNAYKNTTATAGFCTYMDVSFDMTVTSANVNCSLVPATAWIGRTNYSAIALSESVSMGTSTLCNYGGTIHITNVSGATFQDVVADIHSRKVARTAVVPSAAFSVQQGDIHGVYKSTEKMTAIVLVPSVGTFQGGTWTLLGGKKI